MDTKKIINQLEDLIIIKDNTKGNNYKISIIFDGKISNDEEEDPTDYFIILDSNNKIYAIIEVYKDPNSFMFKRLFAVKLKVPYHIVLRLDKTNKFYYLFSKKEDYKSKIIKLDENLIFDELGIEIDLKNLKIE